MPEDGMSSRFPEGYRPTHWEKLVFLGKCITTGWIFLCILSRGELLEASVELVSDYNFCLTDCFLQVCRRYRCYSGEGLGYPASAERLCLAGRHQQALWGHSFVKR